MSSIATCRAGERAVAGVNAIADQPRLDPQLARVDSERGSCRRTAPPVLGAKSTCRSEAPARRAGRPRPAPPASEHQLKWTLGLGVRVIDDDDLELHVPLPQDAPGSVGGASQSCTGTISETLGNEDVMVGGRAPAGPRT